MYADALCTPFARDRLHDLDQQARAVFGAAAVRVSALVGTVAQELVEQEAVGGVHLDAIEAGGSGVRGAFAVLRDDAGKLGGLERPRRDVGLHAVERPRLARRRDRRRRHWQGAIGLQRGMRNSPDMPKLQKNPPAGRMHCVSDELPAGDLRGAVDARRARIAEPLGRYLARLGDDQPGARALRIIGRVQRRRRIARAGPIARHRRHHQAVGEGEGAEVEGRKKIHVIHRSPHPHTRRAVSRMRSNLRH